MTSTPEDTGPAQATLDTWLAHNELRKLEDVDAATALPVAYVAARGFAAVTYALLTLRETYWDQATDLNDNLSDLSDSAGGTAGSLARIAETADKPSLRYRLSAWLTRMRGGAPEPW